MAAASGYAAAPKGSTGECKDGSHTTTENKSGACSGHGGVKDWYGADKASAAKPTAKSEAKTEAKAQAPKGSAGECKDGSYTGAESKSGACSGHGGVKDWYAKDKSAAMPSKARAAAGGSATPSEARSSRAEAGAGGAGRVWVNSSAKVYHCSNDPWYGKAQHGAYMSEAQAKAQGNHADHGKACN
jgi:hypothetical protein